MRGLVKGAAAGLGVAALGFAVLAVMAPPPASPPASPPAAPAAAPVAAPDAPLPEAPPVPLSGAPQAADAAPRIEALAATSGLEGAARLAPPPRPATGGAPVVTTRLPQIAPVPPPPEVAPGAAAVPAPAEAPPETSPASRPARIATGRLPQIGAPETRPPGAAPDAAAPPPERPPLALVLADPGAALPPEALDDLPFALTIAFDPFDPEAPARAARLHAAGHEVALRLDGIAAGATATDLEVMLQVWAQEFPQALALVEPPPGDARRARALAPVLIPAMAARGLALIAPDRGLSPLLAAARAGGVPALGLHRALDAEAEDEAAIRRRLDRAAFEAERLGRAAVWAEGARAQTRAALAGWPGTGRSDRVRPGTAGAALP